MDHPTRPPERIPAHVLAMISGVVGLAAGGFLIAFFALDDPTLVAGFSVGHLNDLLGTVQFAALLPVAVALGRRLPASGAVRVATVVGALAMAAFVVLSVLLVAGVLTFDQQIGPVVIAIVAIYGWLLTVSIVGHRTRTLPRVVTRSGMLLAAAFLVALVLVSASYALPGLVSPVVRALGYGLGTAGWLALPLLVLLLARLVFTRPSSTAAVAAAPLEGVRS